MEKTLGELSDEFDAAKKELDARSQVEAEASSTFNEAKQRTANARLKVNTIRQAILDVLNAGANVQSLG